MFCKISSNTRLGKSAAEGAKAVGAQVTVFTASEFSAGKMDEYDVIAFGCPSMGAEELEEREFAPMFEECESSLNGKKIALFGSYGWGDGEWMRSWEESCAGYSAILAHESVICNESPDETANENCISLGKSLV